MNKGRCGVVYSASKRAPNGEQGLTLLEVLIALGIIAAIAVTFLLGMSTSSKAVVVSQEKVTAESLAKSQMEAIKRWEYDATGVPPDYLPAKLTDIPTGYDIDINAERMDPQNNGTDNDDGLQKVIVTITRGGETVFILEGYKCLIGD